MDAANNTPSNVRQA